MSYARVVIEAVLAPGLVRISYDGDLALWTRAKLRKHATCEITGIHLSPGDMAFRPFGNQQYRSRRISVFAIEDAGV